MMSYTRLTPEHVQFTSPALSGEQKEEEVMEEEVLEEPLLPRKLSCSSSTALLSLGVLLLLLSAAWLLSTIFWLHSPSAGLPHRAPPPAASPGRAAPAGGASVPEPQACSAVPEAWRFDCYPERGVVVTREMCEARNCCFLSSSSSSSSSSPSSSSSSPSSSSSSSRSQGVPWCFYPPGFPSYRLVSLQASQGGQTGRLEREVRTYYPGDIMSLQLDIRHETETRLRVRITDPSDLRYEVPITVPDAGEKVGSPAYSVELSEEPFGIIVKRTVTGAVL